MTPIRIAILGGSGYTAAELLEILLRHPQAQVVAVTSRQGDKDAPLVADLHPRFRNRTELRCIPFDAKALADLGVQVAFGCLPHGISMEAIPSLVEQNIRVVDLSADYRLRDPGIYLQWYKETHADPKNLAHAVYGLPEVYRKQIATARLIANPGCYPQGAALGLLPLVREKLIDLLTIIIDSKSGVSGAGRNPSATTHYPECNESVAAYGVGSHRHTPEIEQTLAEVAGARVQVIFTPHLIPMDRGIFSTIYAQPTRPISEAELEALFRRAYEAEPFVRVTTKLPATKDTLRTNFCDICPRLVRGRIVVLTVLDNLVRGASGVAVQNFNLMHGLPETQALLP